MVIRFNSHMVTGLKGHIDTFLLRIITLSRPSSYSVIIMIHDHLTTALFLLRISSSIIIINLKCLYSSSPKLFPLIIYTQN